MTLSTSQSTNVVVVSNSSDNPFAIDVAYAMGQHDDIADLISMKQFMNSEFCPRFISDETDFENIGVSLEGKAVIIVSTAGYVKSRQELAMANLIIARAAKENGAQRVILVEPDLFYSAQDRGAHKDLGETSFERDIQDIKKFDGQPFTAKLYAQMLKLAGVDTVMTIHNHSESVQKMFSEVFEGDFHNLIPYEIYAHYLLNSDILQYGEDGEGLVLCAPDKGARDFVKEMFAKLGLSKAKFIMLDKERTAERKVEITLHKESEHTFDGLEGASIILFDDMVRTGSTVVKSCQFLQQINPKRMVFAVSHFYASDEGRQKMAHPSLGEILTLNTLPTILNRDEQGRLRKKMVVLKVEKWLAQELCNILDLPDNQELNPYKIDMSSKNPRFKRKIWFSEELHELKSK
ncbi:phosphoribosyltransferase family protein [Marinomonas mediterranea]|jgi:ribose-phosphate pyrophosphokinase|uniref:ribose-phosphate diphosphokinase n=1 Tax=Marinomonas mediterranea (strain ATCC 700492 / JCM 21426 / NBRC 103028 / MMB-1) TaxID=717774 RepID=F2JVQ3_MARM1|nr:phosphoribosyltransferase family protein [Marinomonas mediterranea]ADZ91689.1 ribose-phosphate pyrophosphokinase [Marinomonas mediterranea MMB-1]WCN09640.1 ribose-phosphate pyrophosphokinase-like domain-containing protein [Marinomonas mediterranea]WCN13729.1 ribose-phosphate pyrophosphokinase-like domain-containing protein [Marinomonas mediterranea]WCN17785.1 ribose-phosphate pyrophosphokinase-like domain-containing protein [Marinomonas mediterranea MMB-1]